MASGVGFGPEGDYKTSALMAVMCKMAENRKGATAFMEDYTYELTPGEEKEPGRAYAGSIPRICRK